MGGSYKGITHGLHPCNASSSLAPSTKSLARELDGRVLV